MIKANRPELKSWVDVPENSDFPIQNIPFGILKTKDRNARMATAIGDYCVDLAALHALGLFDDIKIDGAVFNQPHLNKFMALGKAVTRAVRDRISEILDANNDEHVQKVKEQALLKQSEVKMLMPVYVRDYTDFYSSIEHATNVGTMFRGKDNALMPNWKHIPVGYHGRASSIVVSGTPLHRPKGQMRPNDEEPPIYGASKLLDFELEMAFITGKGTRLGDTISTANAEDYIFGISLFNDWSARDIQKWEYVPLGPFLGKNFGSSLSPWIVTLDALEPFRLAGPQQEPAVLPYLEYQGNKNYDINLEVAIAPEIGEAKTVCHSNFKYMYWNMCQQLAHHTVNGCNINVGDLYASGTISGPTSDSYGSMLELAWRGSKPIPMPNGSERKFILDHDTVTMKGWAKKDGIRIGLGEVSTKILPAQ
jgi:fumarylacetoacetase